MRRALSLVCAIMVFYTVMAQAPAFPGAEGHGRYITGGDKIGLEQVQEGICKAK